MQSPGESTPDPAPAPTPQNNAPVLDGSPPLTAKAGTAYSFSPSASDADNDALIWTVTGLPAWASFNEGNGTLSGTPADGNVGQTEDIEITVSDGKAQDSIGPFRITIAARDQAPNPSNAAPAISGAPATTVVAGNAYMFVPTATDANNEKLTFSIANRPQWATFSTANGQLSGTPTQAQVGTSSNIRITVSDGKASASLAPFSIQVQAPPNRAPTISGTPTASVVAGTAYSFKPTASDPDGDTLSYSIANKPAWATFSIATGQLSGTPPSAGSHPGIIISVSDGKTSAALAAFTLAVTAAPSSPSPVTGNATVSWSPPTLNTDGTTLTGLAGYRINYGTSSGNLTRSVEVSNPGLTTYQIDNLSAGTWYFVVKAYTSAGTESVASNMASKTIQ